MVKIGFAAVVAVDVDEDVDDVVLPEEPPPLIFRIASALAHSLLMGTWTGGAGAATGELALFAALDFFFFLWLFLGVGGCVDVVAVAVAVALGFPGSDV